MVKRSIIQTTTIIKIPEGKLEEFKQLAIEAMKIVKEKDTGTLKYDWFINSDGTECEIKEEFESIDALFKHAMNVYRPGGWGDFSIDHGKFYGELPAQYLDILKLPDMPPVKFYSFFQGLD
jgi:quinol monooxygenase YgiN